MTGQFLYLRESGPYTSTGHRPISSFLYAVKLELQDRRSRRKRRRRRKYGEKEEEEEEEPEKVQTDVKSLRYSEPATSRATPSINNTAKQVSPHNRSGWSLPPRLFFSQTLWNRSFVPAFKAPRPPNGITWVWQIGFRTRGAISCQILRSKLRLHHSWLQARCRGGQRAEIEKGRLQRWRKSLAHLDSVSHSPLQMELFP